MLTFSILTTILMIAFYLFNKYDKYSKDVIILSTLFTIATTWSIYLLIDTQRVSLYIQILILLTLIFCLYYISSFNMEKKTSIIYAKQQNYWGIKESKVVNTFKKRSNEKSDRIEVSAPSELLYIEEKNNKIISNHTIAYFKKLESLYKPTIINNINEIEKFKLYNKIFKKISTHLEKDKEIFLDYNSILSKFENNLELFIIHIWDTYSKDFNIGIGQLETMTEGDEILTEFINALDNTNLKMIKLKGSFLQYKYEKFLEEKGLKNG